MKYGPVSSVSEYVQELLEERVKAIVQSIVVDSDSADSAEMSKTASEIVDTFLQAVLCVDELDCWLRSLRVSVEPDTE